MWKNTLLFIIALSLVVTNASGGLFGIFDDSPSFLLIDANQSICDLNDVVCTGLINNQVLAFNSTTGFWENAAQAGGGGGGRTYTGISPITVDNDINVVGLNVLPTSDWNGLFDGNDSTFYIDWNNSVNRFFSFLDLDDNASFDGRYLQESDGNDLYVRLNPTIGQVISTEFDLNHLDGHSFFGHTVFIGDEDDEVVEIIAFEDQNEHVFSVIGHHNGHILTVFPTGETDLNFLADEDEGAALHIDVDGGGFANIAGIEIDYVSGALGLEEEVQVILIAIDQNLAEFGQIDGIQIVATDGDANIHFAEIGILIDPITQLSGTFEDMDSAFVAGVDRLSEFTSTGSNIAMFVNDDDNVLIGNATQFQEIEFLLATVSSGAGIKGVFEHSTGVGTFSEFTPTDTTEGMRQNGVVVWDLELIPDWVVGANNEFLIRITRTRNNLTTVPIESLVQIADATEFFWNKEGSLFVNDINASLLCVSNDCISAWADVNNFDTTLDTNQVASNRYLGTQHDWNADQMFTGDTNLTFRTTGQFVSSRSGSTLDIGGGQLINFLAGGVTAAQVREEDFTIGSGQAGVDYALLFSGDATSGRLSWLEGSDRFSFVDDVLIASSLQLFLRDSQIFLQSPANGEALLQADGRIEFNAPTIDIVGDLNNYTGKLNIVDLNALNNVSRAVSGNGIDVNANTGHVAFSMNTSVNEHIDWTSTSSAIDSTGNSTFGQTTTFGTGSGNVILNFDGSGIDGGIDWETAFDEFQINGNMRIEDDKFINFGTDRDVQLEYISATSVFEIEIGTNDLQINSNSLILDPGVSGGIAMYGGSTTQVNLIAAGTQTERGGTFIFAPANHASVPGAVFIRHGSIDVDLPDHKFVIQSSRDTLSTITHEFNDQNEFRVMLNDANITLGVNEEATISYTSGGLMQFNAAKVGSGIEIHETDVNISTITAVRLDGNVTLTSPNGTKFNCGVTNGGSFVCS